MAGIGKKKEITKLGCEKYFFAGPHIEHPLERSSTRTVYMYLSIQHTTIIFFPIPNPKYEKLNIREGGRNYLNVTTPRPIIMAGQ
jgi:hypothetical protein